MRSLVLVSSLVVVCASLSAASSSSSSVSSRPNILLLFPDQWRYDWDGFERDNQPDIPGGMLRVPNTRHVAASGTRFTTAYVPAPVCAPSRSCLASGREYDEAGVMSNFANDYPALNQSTFYKQMRLAGYHTMTTGKDDLTKASQLGSKLNPKYPGCPTCVDGDGQYHLKELGFSDALRYSGKMDVVDRPQPHEMYGFYLRNHTVALKAAGGKHITGWEAHRACMGKAKASECVNSTFTPELYEDDYTAVNAIELLKRRPKDGTPWFLHVSFPGPHDPFLVTTDMRNAASDGRAWPEAKDNPTGVTPGGACDPVSAPTGTRTRCNYAAEIENLDRLFGLVIDQVKAQGDEANTVVCIASDHGEMLGDHGDTAKSKPWEGSAHVPLMCSGPGIQKNKTVTIPIATMDMAGTFMDLAGAKPSPGMTTQSLRPLLEQSSDSDDAGARAYRSFVSSGLDNFRMVVKQMADGTQYKYICCKGACPGAPKSAPSPPSKNAFVEMLIDIVADPYDMHDLAPTKRDIVDQLRPLLPPAYAVGCK